MELSAFQRTLLHNQNYLVQKDLPLSIRPLNFPADFDALTTLTVASFQYPENEAWSVQADDEENISDMFKSVKQLWSLFRLMSIFSPAMRDLLHGYFWEEDGRPIGMIVMQRRNTTNTWTIGNVGVLPEFRRRGIARKLVIACLDFIRAHGGEVALLDVIAENIPAYHLYQQMGFAHYTSRIEFNYLSDMILPETPLSDGYTSRSMGKFEWRPRFELDKEVTPANVQEFEPVTEAYLNPGKGLMLLSILLDKLGGQKTERIVFYAPEGEIVAIGYYRIRKKEGGVNGLNIRVHPDHPDMAVHLLPFLINAALRLGPGRRIEFALPAWQTHLLDVAKKTGCEKRYEYHSLGLKI